MGQAEEPRLPSPPPPPGGGGNAKPWPVHVPKWERGRVQAAASPLTVAWQGCSSRFCLKAPCQIRGMLGHTLALGSDVTGSCRILLSHTRDAACSYRVLRRFLEARLMPGTPSAADASASSSFPASSGGESVALVTAVASMKLKVVKFWLDVKN